MSVVIAGVFLLGTTAISVFLGATRGVRGGHHDVHGGYGDVHEGHRGVCGGHRGICGGGRKPSFPRHAAAVHQGKRGFRKKTEVSAVKPVKPQMFTPEAGDFPCSVKRL